MMAATIEGSVKALLEEGGFGLAVFRDRAPKDTPLPYLTVESVNDPVVPSGDFGDAAAPLEVRADLDVSLWQPITDPATGRVIERYGLAQSIASWLRGRVPGDVLGRRVYPLVVSGVTRVPTRETNVQRETIAVSALRVTGGTPS
jgi:hypothetical protein